MCSGIKHGGDPFTFSPHIYELIPDTGVAEVLEEGRLADVEGLQ